MTITKHLSMMYICSLLFMPVISHATPLPSFDINNPAVLHLPKNKTIELVVTPLQAVYHKIPNISLVSHRKQSSLLHWKAEDGFGKLIVSGDIQLNLKKKSQNIILPPGHGYYALTVKDGLSGEEEHYSFGILPKIEQKTPDIFGIWVQGMLEYSNLGVSWTRLPVLYKNWENKEYRRKVHITLARLKERGISVVLYPKEVPKSIVKSHNFIRDDPQSWRTFERWLTEMVQEFDGEVGAWGLINEPFAYVLWNIPNEITFRYWKLMRGIVDRYSPNTPLIGPCLNVHKGVQLRQYQELMQMGFGKLIDGVELHTYMRNVTYHGRKFEYAMPENIDWVDQMKKALILAGNGEIKHNIWITEMGMPASYGQELQQAEFVTRSAIWAKYMQARGIPIKLLNWHAFSFPQGGNERERNYSLFRNIKRKRVLAMPQSRPAGIAYGVAIRHLSGAEFIKRWEKVSPNSYVFEFNRLGKKIVVMWTDKGSSSLILSREMQKGKLSNMFGKQLPMREKIHLNTAPLWVEL